jgi:succinate-semialdehyde dehydrogenase / glutarate-semialdehyde dehydrogenase
MSTDTVRTINPATGETLQDYLAFTWDQIGQALAQVHDGQPEWAARRPAERAAHLGRLAAHLRGTRKQLARLAVLEMGKPIGEALAEVDKCAWACEYYAETGPRLLADQDVPTGAQRSWVAHEPLGVILAVMPWNFPYWQVFRFLAPTLMAGNAGLLKHSPNVTGCALAIEDVLRDAGLPPGAFRSLVIAEPDVPAATERLITDPRVAAVSLTGSERAVAAAAAGRALRKSLLELGGSDPFVVLDDVDLDTAVTSAVRSRFLNSGQSYLAAKRFIAHTAVAERFTEQFTKAVDALVVGDPADPATQLGPLARTDLVDALHAQVSASVAAGATVRAGGRRLDRRGAWYAPTVLADVTADMPAMTEETFGPAAAVITVRDDDEAARVANTTRYGLGTSVRSGDPDRALRLGRRISSGALFVNAVVASDPRLPFGGTKNSGYGRELRPAGLYEFTNARTFYVGGGERPAGPATE